MRGARKHRRSYDDDHFSNGTFSESVVDKIITKYFEVEENDKKYPLRVIIELPHWLYRSITKDEVLPISKDYFRLRKPIDRRVYEIARKHCGKQPSWKISLELLHRKTGATMVFKNFRIAINSLAQANVLPDYCIEYDRKSDMVTFINRDDESQLLINQKYLENTIKMLVK